MTITNTFSSGVNTSFSTELNENFNEVENIAKQDQTGGSVSNTTTETEVGEVLIPANTVKGGVMIVATGKGKSNFSSATFTIRLRTGTSATGTSNTVRKTITRDDIDNTSQGWTITYILSSEETWTTDTYVHITSQCSTSSSTSTGTCESITVLGLGDTF